MNYEEFVKELTEQVSELLGDDFDVKCKPVMKNNSTRLIGMSILKKNCCISPTIYLEEYFRKYERGDTILQIAGSIIDLYHETNSRIHSDEFKKLDMSFDHCKDKIIYRLVSRSQNEELLKESPHLWFLDLAIIFSIVHRHTKQGLESIRITNEMMAKWDVTTDQLNDLAKVNTPRLFPVKISKLSDVISAILGDTDMEGFSQTSEHFPLTLLSNQSGINGASVILYPNIISILQKRFHNDFCILPSSIHELLILSIDSEDIQVESLKETVQHVNRVAVTKEEFLSDSIYVYRYSQQRFEVI